MRTSDLTESDKGRSIVIDCIQDRDNEVFKSVTVVVTL